MPHISALKSSKFLTKQDVTPPILVTIQDCVEVNVAQEGAPQDLKWALHFNETEKPLVLNSTNGQIIAGFLGKENTDDWKGHKVVLYHDPNVSFGGKLIGGIRARAPKNQPKPQQPPPVAHAPAPAPEVESDDVPF